MPARPIHSCRARTGQTAMSLAKGIPISLPSPDWSVFERLSSTTTPLSLNSRSSRFKALSSERRSAVAKPKSSSARSRTPEGVSGSSDVSFRRVSSSSGFFLLGRVPSSRRMPSIQRRTSSARVGVSTSAA